MMKRLTPAKLLIGIWLGLALWHLASWLVPDRYYCWREWECAVPLFSSGGPFRPFAHWAGRTHGDLSNLAGVPQLRKYGEMSFSIDEYGFRNPVGQAARPIEIALVGDSFAFGSQLNDDQTLGALVEKKLGQPLYNFSPCSLNQAFHDVRFAQHFPKKVLLFFVGEELREGRWGIRKIDAPFNPHKFSSQRSYESWERQALLKHPHELWQYVARRATRLPKHFFEPLWKGLLFQTGLYSFPAKIYYYNQSTERLFYGKAHQDILNPQATIDRLPKIFRELEAAAEALKERGSELAIALFPSKTALYHDDIPELRGKDPFIVLDRFYEGLPKSVRGIPLHHDLEAIYAKDPTKEYFIKDDVHPTALAVAYAAKKISQVLGVGMASEVAQASK